MKRVVRSILIVFLWTVWGFWGCSANVTVKSNWHPRPIPRGWYQGVGQGSVCNEARVSALKSLCESLYVVVTGGTNIVDQEVLKQRLGADSNRKQTIDYTHLTSMFAKTKTHCVFQGHPYREYKDTDENGACHVQLIMSVDDYVRYLHTRTIGLTVQWPEDLPENARRAIDSAVQAYLMKKGYLVLTQVGTDTANKAGLTINVQVKQTNQSNHFGTKITIYIQVTKTADNSVKETRSINSRLCYGWSKQAALENTAKDIVKKINSMPAD